MSVTDPSSLHLLSEKTVSSVGSIALARYPKIATPIVDE